MLGIDETATAEMVLASRRAAQAAGRQAQGAAAEGTDGVAIAIEGELVSSLEPSVRNSLLFSKRALTRLREMLSILSAVRLLTQRKKAKEEGGYSGGTAAVPDLVDVDAFASIGPPFASEEGGAGGGAGGGGGGGVPSPPPSRRFNMALPEARAEFWEGLRAHASSARRTMNRQKNSHEANRETPPPPNPSPPTPHTPTPHP